MLLGPVKIILTPAQPQSAEIIYEERARGIFREFDSVHLGKSAELVELGVHFQAVDVLA